VKSAREEAYRLREAFKLREIQRSVRMLRPVITLVDRGAAPGGWSQLAAQVLRGKWRIIALDILPMDEIAGVEFIMGDFTSEAVLELLEQALGGDRMHRELSDLAHN